jgi:hypothetical protein
MIYGYDLRLRPTSITRGIIDKACNLGTILSCLEIDWTSKKKDLNVTCVHPCESDSAETKKKKKRRRKRKRKTPEP